MGCGNHHARIYLMLSGEICNGRCRRHTDKNRIGSHRTNSRHQRIGKHSSGNTRITAHNNRRLMGFFFRQHIGSGLPQLHSQINRQLRSGNTSYPVCSKHSSHLSLLLIHFDCPALRSVPHCPAPGNYRADLPGSPAGKSKPQW